MGEETVLWATLKEVAVLTSCTGRITFFLQDMNNPQPPPHRHSLIVHRYSVPHPSERKIHVRIQTYGHKTSAECLNDALTTLQDTTTHMLSTFDAAIETFNAAKPTMDQGN